MPLEIGPFTEAMIDELRAFNSRLSQTGAPYQFPESPVPSWLPHRSNVPLYQEFFLAAEEGKVRGGYILKHQAFFFRGEEHLIADLQYPLSEGIIDPRYRIVALQLIKNALARQPLLFGLGMGGFEEPIARLLLALHWRFVACPFYFWVARPYRFLRKIAYLRRRLSRRVFLDLMAFSGLGWLGLHGLHWYKGRRRYPMHRVSAQIVGDFGDWANVIWSQARESYALIAVREQTILNTLYPPQDKCFIRLRVELDKECVGWAVLLHSRFDHNPYFGNMRLGSVVDCLALPGSEPAVVAAATRHLIEVGADLLVTNQLNGAWCQAFDRTGYFQGPSNYLFAAAPALAARLEPFNDNVRHIHMTRGDGDGPGHLVAKPAVHPC